MAHEAVIDADAFLALYDRYFPRVYTYFRHRCQDLRVCDDLTAQTFEQALDHCSDFRPERGSFAAWLFGIARNVANGYLRRKRRFQWLPFEALQTLSGSDPAPEEAAIQADDRRILLGYIQELPPRQRDVLALKFAGGLTNREIAALTGLSEQNVGVILHRSIAHLRKKMECTEDWHAQ